MWAGANVTATPSSAPAAPPIPVLGTHSVNPTFTDNGRKARYAVAYLESICAQAGVAFGETRADEDIMAVDAFVHFPQASSRVQLKCTSQFKLSGKSLTMTLEPGWVASWTASIVPVYFVVVIVPPEIPDWIAYPLTSTSHKTAAFWVRFDSKVHKTKIRVPKSQRVTLETIHQWKSDLDTTLGLGGAE
jgi:hypothetical protein